METGSATIFNPHKNLQAKFFAGTPNMAPPVSIINNPMGGAFF